MNLSLTNPVELWRVFHDELDLDGNGHLDAEELSIALGKAGEWSKVLPSTNILTRCRHKADTIDVIRFHDLPNLISALPCHQLPGISRLSSLTATESINLGDL